MSKLLIIGMAFLTTFLVLGCSVAMPTDEETVLTVKEKWTKVIGSGTDTKSLYLFSDIQGNVYSIQDTLWHWNFESANRYAKIESGKTYRVWLFGIRNGFFSMYQNAWKIESRE